MQIKPYYTASVLAFLVGCGSTVTNTDKPTGIYIAGATDVTGDFGVNVVEQPPRKNGYNVSGISCKNKLWEPSPTNEAAIAVLKRETQNSGHNSVYIISVQPDPAALAKNCWAAIIAKGIAFTVE